MRKSVTNPHTHRNCYADRNGNAHCYRRAEVYSIAKASPDSAAPAVTLTNRT